jgi:alpha-tubulin suppressor-like RCC1 family protein
MRETSAVLSLAERSGNVRAVVRHVGFALLSPLVACHGGEPFEFLDSAGCGDGCDTPSSVAELGLGVRFSCARFAGGGVKCWGSDEAGVLGTVGARRDLADAREVSLIDFGTTRRVIQLSAGWHHACVVFEDYRARCWGQNDYGQLGLGHTENYGDDVGESLAALPDLPLERVTAISAGVRSTCALVSTSPGAPGQVHCWGSDQGGALGDRSSGSFGDDEAIDARRPAALPEEAVSVATGGDLACALLTTGVVHCWGDNWAKTLGIGETTCDVGDERPCFSEQGRTPDIPVAGLGTRAIVKLEVNQTSACVIDNTGALLCWGRNSQSRLGYPETLVGEFVGATPGPVDLGQDTAIVQVAMGVRHTCVVDTDGRVRCFGERGPALGYAMNEEPGVAGIGGIQTPAEAYALRGDRGLVNVGDFDGTDGIDSVVAIRAGLSSTCVILTGGDVRCWGDNANGELGYGDPAQVGSIGDDETPGEAYEHLDVPSLFGTD